MQKADFLGINVSLRHCVNKLKQIAWNFAQQLIKHPTHFPSINSKYVKLLNLVPQAIFSLLEDTPLIYKIWVQEIAFIILHYK
jgi:hypothetical protein